MRLRIRQSVAIATFAAAAMALLSGCMSVPRYDLFARPHNGVSVGPKVAALIANVQCEIAVAATSRLLLEHYKIDETGELGPVTAVRGPSEDPTDFTLYNWFKNIEYVVATTYQLEVTDTGSFNPSLGFSTFWRPAVDLLPATSAVLSVGGTLSDSGHRQLKIESTIDMGQLHERKHPCPRGTDLAGVLGLRETVAAGIMAHVMNQVRVSPLSKKIENSLSTEFSHGQISAQVDFTVTENVNAGPNYQLKYFLGPGGANLFSYNRLLKDTLTLTFVPACKNLAAASTRADWMPEWVDTLENCGKVKTPLPERQAAPSRPTPAPDTRLQRQVTEQKFKAIVRGFSANNVLILQNVFRR